MVKQVKTKTTLKVCSSRSVRFVGSRACSLFTSSPVHCTWCLAEIGPPAHIPSVRRRVDVHREEPAVQDGVERGRLRAEDQDRGLQERRRHRGGQEVTPFTLNLFSCTLPVVQLVASPHIPGLHSHPHNRRRWYPLTHVIVPCTLEPALEGPVIVALSIVFAVLQKI